MENLQPVESTLANVEVIANPPMASNHDPLKESLECFERAMQGNRSALDRWLEFGRVFGPVYDLIVEGERDIFLKAHFPKAQHRTIRRALAVQRREQAVLAALQEGKIKDFMGAYRFTMNLEKAANNPPKELMSATGAAEPIIKTIEFLGTEEDFKALLKWSNRRGVVVEEKAENKDTPTNVTPMPEPQQPIDPDQQLAA